MEINWYIAIAWFLVNAGCLYVQYQLQYLDLANGRIQKHDSVIPGTTQRFLYMQDFATNSWGDLFGLSLVQVGFIHLCLARHVTLVYWIELGFIAILSMYLFRHMCLGSQHKPDSGFPKTGEISSSGMWHLPYFGINAGIAVVDTTMILTGPLRGPVMWLSLAGGAIYIAAIIYDVARGNFAQLQLQPKQPVEMP